MRAFAQLLVAVFALAIGFCPATSLAQETAPSPQVAWRLLDYLAVDYAGAVSDGEVVNALEYAEMQEFSASVHDRLTALRIYGDTHHFALCLPGQHGGAWHPSISQLPTFPASGA
ncbi:hypothetical protein [Maricaulis sp.]|uniref:hypothetical protein n=1 Tax=Maricaulis sp. TaxID=1486257 RepID=UPI003A931372